MRSNRALDLAYRSLVGVVGTAVLILGVIAIPYPGPGWLILFAGLAILATEFQRARAVLHWTRARYDSWTEWLRGQSPLIKLVVLVMTGAIVLLTLWLLNAFGMVAEWLSLDWDWVRSPLA